ncbi:Uncharacterized protein YydD, contains DUF2326 domain [Myxococcus fulvus]|uniref:Uncharacterized protein YydD, contains DUF2326 domain n=1 Tax=Myxococcus fulvus TaxID=33 RepID=A0A511TDS9_MYXFU|nr:DUF2326 domain-containing protein [Myxococcus fulvus]GEN12317.1 hypothetical protein MFU01_73540 [Myxococcus fulvus]SEU27549.1 Uncharacterized protein YydD, contains DUF2326 domain [Myxococcus fulvus]
MFLSRFRITSHGTVVREVTFRKGLNLVLDVTSGAQTDSGNNVGKTTLLRSIDYCFGSSGEDLYKDPEFRTTNEVIYRFLTEGNVVFELEAESPTRKLNIARPFGEPPIVNGEVLSAKAANEKLGYELFRLNEQKPSFRQLIKKFIRADAQQISNTLKFLHPTTSTEDYEPAWLFLFGFDDQKLLQNRRDLQRKIKETSNQLSGFKGVSTNSLRQMVAVIDRDLAEKQKQLASFEVGPAVRDEIDQLGHLRESITELGLQVAHLQLQLNGSERTIQSLKAAATNIDTGRLEELYKAADRELPRLAHRFSELQDFHNSMISNKVQFIQGSVDRLRSQLRAKGSELESLGEKETQLLRSISALGAFADLGKVHSEINQLRESRGEKTGIISRVEFLQKTEAELSALLSEINDQVIRNQQVVDKRIEHFNKYFSEYSQSLYGEKYVLYYDSRKVKGLRRFEFKIANATGNEGTGKKRAQIAAFDLAYLKMQSELRAETARFTLHDRLETISGNQLQTLFEVADQIDGQFLVCVLADKLTLVDPGLIERATVLKLSQSDKFFRIQ